MGALAPLSVQNVGSYHPAARVLPQGHAAIFVAGASVFGAFAAGCNFSHLKGEELTVIHLLRTAGLSSYCHPSKSMLN